MTTLTKKASKKAVGSKKKKSVVKKKATVKKITIPTNGYTANEKNFKKSQNLYQVSTKEFKDWNEGWQMAEDCRKDLREPLVGEK